jgi:hypothetical protein
MQQTPTNMGAHQQTESEDILFCAVHEKLFSIHLALAELCYYAPHFDSGGDTASATRRKPASHC